MDERSELVGGQGRDRRRRDRAELHRSQAGKAGPEAGDLTAQRADLGRGQRPQLVVGQDVQVNTAQTKGRNYRDLRRRQRDQLGRGHGSDLIGGQRADLTDGHGGQVTRFDRSDRDDPNLRCRQCRQAPIEKSTELVRAQGRYRRRRDRADLYSTQAGKAGPEAGDLAAQRADLAQGQRPQLAVGQDVQVKANQTSSRNRRDLCRRQRDQLGRTQ